MKTFHDQPEVRDGRVLGRLRLLLCGGATKRFHVVTTVLSHTVAEHSWGVAQICDLLCNGKPSVALLQAALRHDLAEQVFGDVPRPAKQELGIDVPLNALEEKFLKTHDCGFTTPLSAKELKILELADCFEAMLCCIQERAIGNQFIIGIFGRYAKLVDMQQLNQIEQYVRDAIHDLWEEADGKAIYGSTPGDA